MQENPFVANPVLNPVAERVWRSKYRHEGDGAPPDADIRDTWRRVAQALASVEREPERWAPRFLRLLEDFRFIPGGRILAGAGTTRDVTLFNCFVMGIIEDSIDGIFAALREGALTLQQGGGIGYDFSTLRPAGTRARRVGTVASGPVSFMRVWDVMSATLLSTGSRRGAMMATLRCDHPDIETFIRAKHEPGVLTHFNLSVQVSDAFMRAVERDEDWPLVFPADALDEKTLERAEGTVQRRWTGRDGPVDCAVLRQVSARALWDAIIRNAYDYAEPGVLFIDRINHDNNLGYREHITATNPCGEIPLPPYGACDLGSLNLARFVTAPFSPEARLDTAALRDAAAVAVRMLDNVIDLSRFPLSQQAEMAHGTRRIGLGITGLADAMVMLGMRYGSPESLAFARATMQIICHTAYRTSIDLSREKGPFPHLDHQAHLERPFIRRMPDDIRDGIARHGIRNSHLLAIAPAGSISLLANNVSSGIEPIFAFEQRRRIIDPDLVPREHVVEDYAYAVWKALHPGEVLPPAFTTAHETPPLEHLQMQAAVQEYVDNAISKTINLPAEIPFEEVATVYSEAWRLGLKGCTTYRPTPLRGQVLSEGEEGTTGARCCVAA